MICALLALAVGFQSPGAPSTPGPSGPNRPARPIDASVQSANEVRAYDLRALRISNVTAPDQRWRLAPQGLSWLIDGDRNFDDSEGEESELFFPGLLADLLGDQLSFEGRSLKVLEDGTMLLIGPAELHANVQRLYDFFREAASERIVLSVEVDRNGGMTKQLVSLPSAVWGQVRLTQTQPIVADIDVEIAQGSGIGDPIVVGVESGLRLDLQAVPAKGGVVLSSILRSSGDPQIIDMDIDLGIRVSTEGKSSSTIQDAKRLQTYQLDGMGSAGAALLPEKGSIQLNAAYGGQVQRIKISHVGGALAHRREVKITEGGQSLVLLNEHTGAPSHIGVRGSGLVSDLVRPYMNSVMSDAAFLSVNLSQGPGPEVLDLISSLGLRRKMMTTNFGPWRVLGPRGADFATALASYEQQVGASIRSPKPMEVSVELFMDGQLVSAYTCNGISGANSIFSVGRETLDVIDYDVEVAQFAAIPDPTIAARFDGMLGMLRVTPASDGSVSLVVRAAATWTASNQAPDLGHELMDGMQQATQGRLFVDERRVVFPDGPEWSVTFGEESGSGASLRVTLVQ